MKIECIKTGINAGVQEYYVRFRDENTISITLTERDLLITLTERDLLDLLDEVQTQLSKDDGVINLLQMNRSIQDLTDAVAKLSNEILELKMSIPANPQRYPQVIYKTEPLTPGPITCTNSEDNRLTCTNS